MTATGLLGGQMSSLLTTPNVLAAEKALFLDITFSDLVLALIGAVVGTVLAKLVSPSNAPSSLNVVTIYNHITVNQTHAGGGGESARAEPGSDPSVWIALAVLSIAGYLVYRAPIIGGLAWFAFATCGFGVFSISWLRRHGAIRGLNAFLLASCLVALPICVLLVREGLLRPDYVGRYGELLRSFDEDGLSGLVKKGGLEAVFFVGYQVVSLILIVFAVGVAAMQSVGAIAVVNLSLGAAPTAVWRFVLKRNWFRPDGVKLAAGAALVMAITATQLANGQIFALVQRFADSSAPSISQIRVEGERRPILTLRLSEPARVEVDVAPGSRPSRQLRTVAGGNRLQLIGSKDAPLKPGIYELVVRAVDAAGNRSRVVKVKHVVPRR